MSRNDGESARIAANVIIKANIADKKGYNYNSKQILNQKEQIKLPPKERRRGIEGLAKEQQITIVTQEEKAKKKKKHQKRNRPERQILLKTDMLEQDPRD